MTAERRDAEKVTRVTITSPLPKPDVGRRRVRKPAALIVGSRILLKASFLLFR